MSIPAWQYKLEEAEFRTKNDPQLMIAWLLEHPNAKEIPDEIRNARLTRYGYVPPVAEPAVKPKRKTTVRKTIRPMTADERTAAKLRKEMNDDV